MKNKKAICVLGGMGPQASIYLYKLLIEKSFNNFGAINNDDFPDIILHSVPVPDFISNDQARDEALKMLKQKVRLVNRSNAGCISIACNTAHVLLPELQKISKVTFVSIIEAVAEQVNEDGMSKIGLLGTPSTIKYGLYQTALSKYGISVVLPSERQTSALERIIRNVLSGKPLVDDAKQLKKIADALQEKGAQAIILGCTELPLVFPKKNSLPVYSSVEILAMALLKKCYEQEIKQKGGEDYGENEGKTSC